jgi:pimeloyl-ACP methyl ester carboxylesterase
MGTAADHFTATQARLLQEMGTPIGSRFLMIQAPAARVQQVHVLEAGRDGAPPVVLLHGGNSIAAAWEPLLSLLQGDFRLYAPDRPGCGLTDMLDYHGVSFREHAMAFVGGVLDALGLP